VSFFNEANRSQGADVRPAPHIDRKLHVVSNGNVDPNYVNPYQPPSPGVGYVMDLGSPPNAMNLADVGTRLIGSIIDGLLYLPVVIPGVVVAGLESGEDPSPLSIALMMLGILALVTVQCYLITTSGQSIAKKILRIRIVRQDGSPVNFVHGVVLRSWLMAFLTNIPLFGAIIGLVDAVMIFGNERRCLHDRIASTDVIKV